MEKAEGRGAGRRLAGTLTRPQGCRTVTWAGNTSVLSYSPGVGRLSSWLSLTLTGGLGMDGRWTWKGRQEPPICALVLKPALGVEPT